jgi:hypothetical protein
MKKTILSFFIGLSICFSVTAQTYIPLVTDSGTYYRTDYTVNNGCTGILGTYQYVFSGDTLINSSIYKKVNKSGWISNNICYIGTPLGYQGALRDDSLQRKVFIVKPGQTNEELVYDFNLNIGDTVFSVLLNPSACQDIIIDGIDSVLINNMWHKRWLSFQAGCLPYNALYVEGIGNLDGLLDYYIAYIIFNGGPELICINNNGTIIYPNQGTSCGFVGVTEVNKNNFCKINLVENKNELAFTLENNSSPCPKIEFKVYDINGREIISGNLFGNYTLNKKKISKGMLLIKFFSSNKIIQTNKIINP